MSTIPLPPQNIPLFDQNMRINQVWSNYFLALQGISLNAAPVDAKYLVGTHNATLTDEYNLGALASGYLKITVALGVATPSSAATIPLTDVQTLTASTYTPTLTNVTNLSASTPYACQYLRVGSAVTVSGKVDVDPTGAGAAELGISLPIASNFTAIENCGGTAAAAAVAGQSAAILADVSNDRASMQWIAVDVANQAMAFSFTYQVI